MVARSWTKRDTQFSRLFGRNIKTVRLHIGWNQVRLAQELIEWGSFFEPSQISCIERGKYANREPVRVYVDDMMSFIGVLGIPPRVMLAPMDGEKWWKVITPNPFLLERTYDKKEYSLKVAEHFKKCRESTSLTQTNLASKLNNLGLQISRNSLSRVESGSMSRGVSVDHLMYLAMAFADDSPELTAERWLLGPE